MRLTPRPEGETKKVFTHRGAPAREPPAAWDPGHCSVLHPRSVVLEAEAAAPDARNTPPPLRKLVELLMATPVSDTEEPARAAIVPP